MISTHVLNRRGKGVHSPADALTLAPGPSPPSSDYADQHTHLLDDLNQILARDLMDPLVRIKRAILAGRYAFSEKARLEMEADGLTELEDSDLSFLW